MTLPETIELPDNWDELIPLFILRIKELRIPECLDDRVKNQIYENELLTFIRRMK